MFNLNIDFNTFKLWGLKRAVFYWNEESWKNALWTKIRQERTVKLVFSRKTAHFIFISRLTQAKVSF